MLRTLLYAFLIFALWALFGRWYYVCRIKECDCCESGAKTALRASNLRLTKNGSPDVLRGYQQFFFGNNAASPDLNDDNKKFLAETAAYLKAHVDETITITACSRAKEEVSLGQKRAESLRAELVKLGINASRIKIAGCVTNDDLSTSAAFTIDGAAGITPPTTDGLVQEKPDDELNITISDENFAYNSAVFNPKGNFVNRTSEIKNYIAKNPNVAINITGHTDSKGNDDYNMKLGMRRAEAVKKYFRSRGINLKINTSSKGESAPIASNDTNEGRAKNRRVKCEIVK